MHCDQSEWSSFAVLLRISIAIDLLSMRSECLLIWNARLPWLPSETRRNSTGYSKALDMHTAEPLPVMTVPATMNYNNLLATMLGIAFV
jgi:hypothetical protein